MKFMSSALIDFHFIIAKTAERKSFSTVAPTFFLSPAINFSKFPSVDASA